MLEPEGNCPTRADADPSSEVESNVRFPLDKKVVLLDSICSIPRNFIEASSETDPPDLLIETLLIGRFNTAMDCWALPSSLSVSILRAAELPAVVLPYTVTRFVMPLSVPCDTVTSRHKIS